MKRFLLALSIILPAGAFAVDCNPTDVMNQAAALSSSAGNLARTAYNVPGYGVLSNEALRLSSEADVVRNDAQSGASCAVIQGDFARVQDEMNFMTKVHGEAQATAQNGTIQQAFNEAAAYFQALSNAVFVPVVVPPTNVTVDCGSHNYQYRFCPVEGHIEGVTLTQVVSNASCVEGRSWGWKDDGVWVDRGCHGIFVATVVP